MLGTTCRAKTIHTKQIATTSAPRPRIKCSGGKQRYHKFLKARKIIATNHTPPVAGGFNRDIPAHTKCTGLLQHFLFLQEAKVRRPQREAARFSNTGILRWFNATPPFVIVP